MHKFLVILLTVGLIGCASIDKTASQLKPGMSKSWVETHMGPAKHKQQDGDALIYHYSGDYTQCAVRIVNDVVEDPGCSVDAAAKLEAEERANRRAAALRDMGDNYGKREGTSFGEQFNKGRCTGWKPMARSGCSMVCISGQWQSVCR